MRNRFKGLDLIDRVPDKLWTEVSDIVQEKGIKTIPMEKICKKAKWLSGEALQIAVSMFSVCLPSDALLQHLPFYLGFSYLGQDIQYYAL